MLIEDDPAIANLITVKLQAQGHEVVVFEQGEPALKNLEAFSAELIILDVNLPVMSGFEVAKRVRKRAGLGLPILMLTAHTDLNSRLKGLAYADDYLTKPFALRELDTCVTALLEPGA